MLRKNHKAVTEEIFSKISEERVQSEIKLQKIEVLTNRVNSLIENQKAMHASLQKSQENIARLEEENKKLKN